MNSDRTLSGVDSSSLRHLSLPSSTSSLIVGGNIGSFGQVLTKNEDTNKLEWDDIEKRNIAPNSIDGSRLTTDIGFLTTGSITLHNPTTDLATLTADKLVSTRTTLTNTDYGLDVNGNAKIGGNLSVVGNIDLEDITTDDIIIENRAIFSDTGIIQDANLIITSSTGKIDGLGDIDTTAKFTSTKSTPLDTEFGLEIYGNSHSRGNISTLKTLKSTKPISVGEYGLDITGNALIGGDLTITGSIVLDNAVLDKLYIKEKLIFSPDGNDTNQTLSFDTTTGDIIQYETFDPENQYMSIKNGAGAFRSLDTSGDVKVGGKLERIEDNDFLQIDKDVKFTGNRTFTTSGGGTATSSVINAVFTQDYDETGIIPERPIIDFNAFVNIYFRSGTITQRRFQFNTSVGMLSGWATIPNQEPAITWRIENDRVQNTNSETIDYRSNAIFDRITINGNTNTDVSPVFVAPSIITGSVIFDTRRTEEDFRFLDSRLGGTALRRVRIAPSSTPSGITDTGTISNARGFVNMGGSIFFPDTINLNDTTGTTSADSNAVCFGTNEDVDNTTAPICIRDVNLTNNTGGLIFQTRDPAIIGKETDRTKCFNLDLTDSSNFIPTQVLDPHESLCRLSPPTEVKFPDRIFTGASPAWWNWDTQFKTGEGGTFEGDGNVDNRWFLTIPALAIPTNRQMRVGFSIYMEEMMFGSDGSGTTGNRDAFYRWNFRESSDSYVAEYVIGRTFTYLVSGEGGVAQNNDSPPNGYDPTKRSRGGSMLIVEDVLEFPADLTRGISYHLFPRFSNKPNGGSNTGRAYFQFAYGGERSDALLWSNPVPTNFTDIDTDA